MKRREFLKKSFKMGLGAGTYLVFGDQIKAFTTEKAAKNVPFDLVAIKGGEPDSMFNRAIESLGGDEKIC